MQKKVIFDIPQNRENSFGATGKMLLSCLAAVPTLTHKIPTNKFITTDFLCKQCPLDKNYFFLRRELDYEAKNHHIFNEVEHISKNRGIWRTN